jgi:hypothetical protein
VSKRIVTLPDGRRFRVTAPDDADDDEIFAFALHSLILNESKEGKRQDEEAILAIIASFIKEIV